MARGGGNVTHVPGRQLQPRENPLAVFAQQLPGIMGNLTQMQYMQQLMAQQQGQQAAAQATAAGKAAGAAEDASYVRQLVQHSQPAQAPQSYEIPTFTQGFDGSGMTPTGSVQGVDGGRPAGYLAGAMSPIDQERLAAWSEKDRAATAAIGNANVRSEDVNRARANVNSAAVGIASDLKDREARGMQAQAIRASRIALQGLPPEDARIQEGLIEASARMVEGGVNPQAVEGMIRHLHPNVQQRVETERTRQQITQATSQNEADSVATPILAKMFNIPQIDGLTIWGSGTELLKVLGNDRNSAQFAGNERQRHANKMTEIKAEGAAYAGGGGSRTGFDPIRTVIETAVNRHSFGRRTGQDQTGKPITQAVDLPAAIDQVLAELQVAAPGIFTAEVAAKLKSSDPQVLSDYAYYRDNPELTEQSWTTLIPELVRNGRSLDQVRGLHELLQPVWRTKTKR